MDCILHLVAKQQHNLPFALQPLTVPEAKHTVAVCLPAPTPAPRSLPTGSVLTMSAWRAVPVLRGKLLTATITVCRLTSVHVFSGMITMMLALEPCLEANTGKWTVTFIKLKLFITLLPSHMKPGHWVL